MDGNVLTTRPGVRAEVYGPPPTHPPGPPLLQRAHPIHTRPKSI
jgi:hypothetical protein